MTRRAVPARVGTAAVALLAGAGAGAGAGAWVHHDRSAAVAAVAAADPVPGLVADPGDRVGATVAALREDGVYVAPDARDLVDADGERRLEEAVAAQDVPVYVAVWAPGSEVGMDDILVEDVLVASLPDEDGVLYLWQGTEDGAATALGPSGGFPPLTSSDFVGDPATTLAEGVAAVSADDFYERDGDDGDDPWGGVAGGALAGLLIGLLVASGVLLVGWIVLAVATARRRTR